MQKTSTSISDAMTMPRKYFQDPDDIHLARRLWHFSGVMGMFAIYFFLSRQQCLRVALVLSTFLVFLDVARLRFEGLNNVLTGIFKPFMRESERHRIAGSTFMLVGVTLIVYLYSKKVVLLALLFLAIADPLAAFIGINFGKDKLIGNKSLQGSSAAFVACFALTFGYCSVLGMMTDRLLIVSLLGGIIGALSELIPVGSLDDNFVFPVVSATLLTVLFYVFGGLS